jgi:hypothetical protein
MYFLVHVNAHLFMNYGEPKVQTFLEEQRLKNMLMSKQGDK